MPKQRLLKYDVIRIVAICMVLMIHATAYTVSYCKDPATPQFVIVNILNCIARAGTPMFLMLTGALLLDENRKFDTKTFYKKNFLTIVLLLVFWLLFYGAWRAFALPALQGKTVELAQFWEYLLKLTGRFKHLWYLFMLVGVYLVIPILRLFVKKENRYYILALILIAVVAQFAMRTSGLISKDIGTFFNKFHLEYATGYLPYVLIGWYLSNFPPKKWGKYALVGTGAVALIGMILAVQFMIKDVSAVRSYVAEMDTLPAMLYGVGLFTLLGALCKDRETKSPLVKSLSVSAFGIYILHVFILDILIWLVPYKTFGFDLIWLYTIVIYLVDLAITYGLVFLFTRIKGVKFLFKG